MQTTAKSSGGNKAWSANSSNNRGKQWFNGTNNYMCDVFHATDILYLNTEATMTENPDKQMQAMMISTPSQLAVLSDSPA